MIKRLYPKNLALVAVAGIATLGAVLVIASNAATPTASLEVEQGSVASPSARVGDTSAAGGNAVKFGSGATAPGRTCTNPVFTTSNTNGGWSNGGYYVHNNVWNAGEAGPETLYACAYNNWYVTSTQPNSTSVKAYPNVHLDINNMNGRPISNYSTITSTFAATSPHVGIYNVAYDIWVNGVGWGDGHTEFMIWTENYKQVPLGRVVSTFTSGGMTYDVWRYTSTSDGGVQVITYVPRSVMLSGNPDLKAFFNYSMSQSWLATTSIVNQIDFGVEICSTNNQPATWNFTDFSITMN